VPFCRCVDTPAAHYAGVPCAACRDADSIPIVAASTMAQNATAATDGDGGVAETKEDAEYEDTNNHDDKKTSIRTSLANKLDRTCNFFWDPATKTVLGRTWISWGTLSTHRSIDHLGLINQSFAENCRSLSVAFSQLF